MLLLLTVLLFQLLLQNNDDNDGDDNLFLGIGRPMKVLGLISSRHHFPRFSPSQISDTLQAAYELAQNLWVCWMKLCSCNSYYAGATTIDIVLVEI